MTKKAQSKVTPVKGGWVKRDAETGRFVSVQGSKGVAKESLKSLAAAKLTSSKRSAALKRLANR